MSLTIFKRDAATGTGPSVGRVENGPFAARACEIRPDFACLAVENDGEMPTKSAALCFPGAQLLLMRGTYAAPELLALRIDQRQNRDADVDIGVASRPEGGVS